ncbi:MAG TPA: hypothetical protein VLA42_18200 [Verrucomicrobiae bacterium]|jgi:hypothetical protein|nr:hypothetical protein [Verrucomicrobiae bacterium]
MTQSEVIPLGEAVETVAKRKCNRGGRPRKFEVWFPRVARTMGDGTTLPRALAANGIVLSPRAIKLLWKSRGFRRLYKIERYLYLHKDSNNLEALRKFASERIWPK